MTYYIVYELDENKNKRRIYTFDNATSAHDMLEFIIRNDSMPIDIIVEEHEVSS